MTVTHIYVTTIKEKEIINLKESREWVEEGKVRVGSYTHTHTYEVNMLGIKEKKTKE